MVRFSSWLTGLVLLFVLAACAPAAPPSPTAAPAKAPTEKPVPTPAVSLLATPTATRTPQPRPLKWVIPGGTVKTIGNDPADWGNATGIFDKYGLAVNGLFVATAPQSISAVLSGQAEVVSLGFYGALGAIAEGADLKVVGQLAVSLPWVVLSKKEYTSIRGLKGTRIGVDAPGSQAYYVWPQILRANGMSLDDVRMVPLVGAMGRMDALMAGGVDAIAEPFDRMFLIKDQPGLRVLDMAASRYVPSAGGAILVQGSYIKSRPDVVRDVVKSTIEMVRTFQTDYGAYERMVGKVYEGRFTPEEVKGIWEALRDAKMWAVNGGINPKAIRQGIDFYFTDVNPSAAGNPRLTVENVVVDDFVREALAELGTVKSEWDPR